MFPCFCDFRKHRSLWCLRVCDQCGRYTGDCQNTDTCYQISSAHMHVSGFACVEGVVSSVGSVCVMTVLEGTRGRKHQLSSSGKTHRAHPQGSLGKVKPALWGQACGTCRGSGEGKTRIQGLNSSEMWELWAPGMGALSESVKFGQKVEE